MTDNGDRGTTAPWAAPRHRISAYGTVSGYGCADPDAPRRQIPLDLDALEAFNDGTRAAIEANRGREAREKHARSTPKPAESHGLAPRRLVRRRSPTSGGRGPQPTARPGQPTSQTGPRKRIERKA